MTCTQTKHLPVSHYELEENLVTTYLLVTLGMGGLAR